MSETYQGYEFTNKEIVHAFVNKALNDMLADRSDIGENIMWADDNFQAPSRISFLPAEANLME